MNKKRKNLLIILSPLICLILAYSFIWLKYEVLNSPVNQKTLDKAFNYNYEHPAVLDSIIYGNYVITYLTNKRNNYDDIRMFNNYEKQAYILFVPEGGHTANDFLAYFKDTDLSNKFHFIALDNIKDISNQSRDEEIERNYQYSNKNLVESFSTIIERILKQENSYYNQIRIVTTGQLAVLGIAASNNLNTDSNKSILINASISERFALSKWYSDFVTNKIGKKLFPNLYVNKHRYLCMVDNESPYLERYLGNAAYEENKENSEQYSMYRGAAIGKELKVLFFNNLSNSDKKSVEKVLNNKANFVYNDTSVNIYKPKSLMDYLYKCDDYTLDFNTLENRAKQLKQFQEKNR